MHPVNQMEGLDRILLRKVFIIVASFLWLSHAAAQDLPFAEF